MTRSIQPITRPTLARAATLSGGLLVLTMSCLSATRLSAPTDSGELPVRHMAADSAAEPSKSA
jgi:hypothetical protein